jgi:hypothetical protein
MLVRNRGILPADADAITVEADPWYGADITVYRDGRFDITFSYDPPEYD